MPAHFVNAFQRRFTGWLRVQLAGRSGVHVAALALVWLAMATSGLVFTEPCPTDLVTIALIVLLPVVGLVRFGPALSLLLLVAGAAAAFGFVSAMGAYDIGKAITHTVVSLYLYGATIVFAAFIAAKPEAHCRLIFNGLTVAAVIAAATGIAGYFGVVPDADLFTKFARASGTFKDPNVFGPFLVPPLLYALHTALERPLKRACLPLALAGFLALGVFLSFSRGAWMNMIVALGVYIVLALLTANSLARRQKIAFLSVFSAGLVAAIVAGALQIEQVSRLLADRASVAQSYDVGPEGRFGGQEKAVALILENPAGIGAQQFALVHHHEEVHNVYLSMALNAGWLGAGLYTLMVAATMLAGFAYAFKRTPAQPFLLIAIAAFTANAFEGVIIDTDHWRHFYLLMAIVWGTVTATQTIVAPKRMPVMRGRAPRLVAAYTVA